MFTKEQILEPLYWVAYYDNGSRVDQYSTAHPAGMSTEQLSRNGLRRFCLMDMLEAVQIFEMKFIVGSKFFYRKHASVTFKLGGNSFGGTSHKYFYQVAQIFPNGAILNCGIDCQEKKMIQLDHWGNQWPYSAPLPQDIVPADELIIT